MAESFDDIMVRCPIPGHEGELTLGEFMKTEVGQRVGGQALKNVELLIDTGMEQDQAVIIAFGGAAVTNEQGQIIRAPAAEAEPQALAAASPAAGEK